MITVDGSKGAAKMRKVFEILNATRAKEAALAGKYLEIVKQRTPVGKSTWGQLVVETGATQRSWKIHMIQNDRDGVRWVISPDGREDIVFWLEFGTKAHVILPKKPGGVLVFDTNKGTIFTKIVHHPITRPLGFVRMTQDEIDTEARYLAEQLHAKLRSL